MRRPDLMGHRSTKSEVEIEADEAIDTFDELVRQRDELHAQIEHLRAALVEVLTIDHSKRGCCEWHILNGKPWIPMPSSVLHVNAEPLGRHIDG